MSSEKLTEAFVSFNQAEEKEQAIWAAPASEVEDDFANDIKATAKTLLGAIKKTSSSAYELEAGDLAKLARAVCDLQNTFYGKSEQGATFIQTNQLAMFKEMLK